MLNRMRSLLPLRPAQATTAAVEGDDHMADHLARLKRTQRELVAQCAVMLDTIAGRPQEPLSPDQVVVLRRLVDVLPYLMDTDHADPSRREAGLKAQRDAAQFACRFVTALPTDPGEAAIDMLKIATVVIDPQRAAELVRIHTPRIENTVMGSKT